MLSLPRLGVGDRKQSRATREYPGALEQQERSLLASTRVLDVDYLSTAEQQYLFYGILDSKSCIVRSDHA
jgi:hypothetical protein